MTDAEQKAADDAAAAAAAKKLLDDAAAQKKIDDAATSALNKLLNANKPEEKTDWGAWFKDNWLMIFAVAAIIFYFTRRR